MTSNEFAFYPWQFDYVRQDLKHCRGGADLLRIPVQLFDRDQRLVLKQLRHECRQQVLSVAMMPSCMREFERRARGRSRNDYEELAAEVVKHAALTTSPLSAGDRRFVPVFMLPESVQNQRTNCN